MHPDWFKFAQIEPSWFNSGFQEIDAIHCQFSASNQWSLMKGKYVCFYCHQFIQYVFSYCKVSSMTFVDTPLSAVACHLWWYHACLGQPGMASCYVGGMAIILLANSVTENYIKCEFRGKLILKCKLQKKCFTYENQWYTIIRKPKPFEKKNMYIWSSYFVRQVTLWRLSGKFKDLYF